MVDTQLLDLAQSGTDKNNGGQVDFFDTFLLEMHFSGFPPSGKVREKVIFLESQGIKLVF